MLLSFMSIGNSSGGSFSNEIKRLDLEVSLTKTHDPRPWGTARPCLVSTCLWRRHCSYNELYIPQQWQFMTLGCEISLAAGAMISVNKSIWSCRYLCRRAKLHFFKAPILRFPVSETWTLSRALESRLDVFCNRSLCLIMRNSWPDHESNQQLHFETSIELAICTNGSSSLYPSG